MGQQQPSIVILGGGFAGIRAALDLDRTNKEGIRIVLVDRNSYHLFTPWLYEQAATADVPKRQLKIPYTAILGNSAVECIRGEVVGIDRAGRTVKLRSGQVIPYTALVLACGSTTNTYGIRGIDRYALPLKTLEDAERIRATVRERYAAFTKRHRDGDVFQVLIGGGGPTGIELTAQLHSYLKELAHRYERDEGTFLIKLLDSGDSLLRGQPAYIGTLAQRRLGSYRRLEILLQHTIAKADRTKVYLKTGDQLAYDVLIWTGGIQANPLVSMAELATTACAQAAVERTMQSISDPAVFVAGDAAFCVDPSAAIRAQAGVENAYQQGRIAATNALRLVQGQPLVPMTQQLHGNVFPLKDQWAVSSVFGIPLSGRAAYWLMLLINLRYLLHILPPLEAFRRWRP